jgi:hypothetical protein
MNQRASVFGLISLAMAYSNEYPAAYVPAGEGYKTWAGMLIEEGILAAEGFTCPEFAHGGLPAANPVSEYSEPGQTPETSGAVDIAPPWCAFTVNEAVCPRPRFTAGSEGAVRASRQVNFAEVESDVVLLTEFDTDWRVLSQGNGVCRSYLPVHGLIGIGPMGSDRYDLNGVGENDGKPCFANGCYRDYRNDNLLVRPVPNIKNPARLNLVGRNHGNMDSNGFYRTSIAFVDGHALSTTLPETLETSSWGHMVYSITGDQRITSVWSQKK